MMLSDPEKAFSSIVPWKPAANVTVFNVGISANALVPMYVTDAGMWMLVRPDPLKAR